MPAATPSPSQRDLILVVVLTGIGCVLRLAFFNGLYGHDDWAYLFYIRSFLNGQTTELLHTPLGLRFFLWLPIATLFKVFGVSYAAAFFPGMLAGLATIPLAYGCMRKLGLSVSAAFAGGLVLLLNPIDWIVSTTIRGDIEMSFYGGTLLLLLFYFREATGRTQWLIGLATGLVWGLSALTKEWGYVFAWGFLAVAAYDLVTRRRLPWEYLAVGAGFFLVLAADALVLRIITGNWLARVGTSLSWYKDAAAQGGYDGDRSKEFSYLPGILLGLRNPLTEYGRFVNGYPYYGIYMWLVLAALPLGLGWRGPHRVVAWFVTGILLWIEFGSMSWSGYLPYHKEPRYLAIVSVPAAVLVIAAGVRVWNFPLRFLRIGLILVAGAVVLVTIGVVRKEHQEYTRGRDVVPAVIAWLGQHPQARLWTSASLQNELDLRSGYRFADPVHRQAGTPGFGAIMDVVFWDEQHREGDYVLVTESWESFREQAAAVRPVHLDPSPVATLHGPASIAWVYRARSREAIRDSGDLSDWDPVDVSQSFGRLHFDSNINGTPLVLAGVRYDKGLGAHANSKVTYRLNGNYSLFTSLIGLDDSQTGGIGSIVFEVWLDDRRAYQSKVMHAGDPPETIRIDVTGATLLQLVVTDAGDGNHCDHGDWVQPRLIKAGAN